MTEIVIDEVIPKENMPPMLVNFQNGFITEQFTAQECMVFSNTENDKKTLATAINGIVYTGEEKVEEVGKVFIMARNRITGKARLIETGIVDMKPLLETENKPQILETNNLELSRKFSSKKYRQNMERKEKLKNNLETVTQQMQNVVQEVSKDNLDIISSYIINTNDFYIPPIDRGADAVEKVYDIDKILTQSQYEMILSDLEGKDYSFNMIPLVKNILPKIVQPKLKVLAVYANSLFKLHNTVAKEIMKKNFVICSHSFTLNDIILTDFLSITNGRKTRPAPFKDKTLCFAIVLLLIINKYNIELDSICAVAKLTPNIVSKKVRVTGASIVRSGSNKIVQLKLPLNTKMVFADRKSTKF